MHKTLIFPEQSQPANSPSTLIAVPDGKRLYQRTNKPCPLKHVSLENSPRQVNMLTYNSKTLTPRNELRMSTVVGGVYLMRNGDSMTAFTCAR